MADNTTLNAGAGGDTLAADDIGGVKFQRVKIAIGADGTNDGDVSSANPLPVATHAVTQSGTWDVRNVSGTVSLPTGAATAAKQPALGTAGSASADVISIQGVASMTPVATTVGLATSGGFSNSSINAAASNNATSVKGSAGQVYGVHVYNNAAYPVYVKLYNKATAPAPATDNALLIRRIGVQAGTQRDLSFPAGLPFSSGIGLAIVKGISDTDNTSVAANDCLVETEYA